MTDHTHISDLRWDRLLAGELSSEAAATITTDAAGCSECLARRAQLTRERDLFAQRPIPMLPRRRPQWWLAVPVLAAAAIVLLVVLPSKPEGERTKGDGAPSLVLTVGGERVLSPGDRVRPGDRLQAGYRAQTAGFGAVLARDGARAASAYVPSRGEVMVALPPGTDVSFPESTILDQVGGEEIVVVIWCASQQPLAPLLAELRARGEIAPRDGCTQRRLTLDKRAGIE